MIAKTFASTPEHGAIPLEQSQQASCAYCHSPRVGWYMESSLDPLLIADRPNNLTADRANRGRHSPPSQFVDFCPNCESSKDYEQNYIQMHDTLPIFPARSFCDRDATLPNHFRMRAWPFAVFARKSSLQAFRQNRRPQWLW
jgi:hypothetical protein